MVTNEILSSLVSQEVQRALEDNQDYFVSEFASCLDAGEQVDPLTIRLVTKAIKMSTQLSVQLVIRTLETCGVLSLPPDGTPILHDLSDDS